MESELKPCPFCGGPAKLQEVDGYRPSSPVTYTVVCEKDCGLYILDLQTAEEATGWWNRREGVSIPSDVEKTLRDMVRYERDILNFIPGFAEEYPQEGQELDAVESWLNQLAGKEEP